MYKNKALIDRVLDILPNNENSVMVYRRLMLLIEEYNRMARDKGLPTKKIPVYSNNINYALIRKLTVSILKDIDRVKNIKREQDGEDTTKEKVLNDVKFTDNAVDNGIWTYTIIPDTNTVKVVLNVNSLSGVFDGESVTLSYKNMPYEKLITGDGTEYLTVSYKEAFNGLPTTVTSLTIEKWTNRNVQDISSMFYGCSSLTALDLSGFDTASVKNMSLMFYECSLMAELTGINKWDTSKVESLNNTFGRCTSLSMLDLSGWNVSAVTDAYNMLTSCDNLEAIYVNKSVYNMLIPVRYVTGISFSTWYYGDTSLLPTLRWEDLQESISDDTIIIITAFSSILYDGTFNELETSATPSFVNGIYKYTIIEDPFNTEKRVINATLNDKTITELDIPESVTPGLFVLDNNKEQLPVSSFADMFYGAESLTFVNVSKWNTKVVTDMSTLFGGCTSLTDITGLSEWDMDSAINMDGMFVNCESLTEIKGLGEWNVSNVTDMKSVFHNCNKLQSLSLAKWVLHDGAELQSMFTSCEKLIILTIPINMAKQFYNSSTTIGLDFNIWYYGDTQLSNETLDSISTSVATFTKNPATVLYYDSAFPTNNTSFAKDDWQYKIYKADYTDPDNIKPPYIEARLTNGALSAGNTPSSPPPNVITDTDFASLPVLSMKQAFFGSMATSINTTGWSISSFINDMSGLFSNCLLLTSVTLPGLVKSNITNLYGMFAGCTTLTNINGLDDWDTTNVTDMGSMFQWCTALESLTLGDKFDTPSETDISDMFSGCSNLASLTLYQISSSIVKELPSATWTIKDNTSSTVGNVVVVSGTSAEWSSEVPTTWTNHPWTLSRTI